MGRSIVRGSEIAMGGVVTGSSETEKHNFPKCCHPQDFRKTIRTSSLQQGLWCMVIPQVQKWEGHSSLQLCDGQSKSGRDKGDKYPKDGVDEEFFWTDSQVVLGYINNEVRRFHVFVANCVQLIREKNDPSLRHYVDTAENPADHAKWHLLFKLDSRA